MVDKGARVNRQDPRGIRSLTCTTLKTIKRDLHGTFIIQGDCGGLEGYRQRSDTTPPGVVHLKFRKHYFLH